MNTETDPEFDPFATDKAAGRGGLLAMVAWLGLLLALAVAAWNGWQWWLARTATNLGAQQQIALGSLEATQAELDRRLAELRARLEQVEQSGLETGLDDLAARISANSSVTGAHRERLESLEQEQAAQVQRTAALESALAALVVRGEAPSRRLELAEIDYLLRTASERLQLFADTASAERALALADAQLQAIDDPLYTPVRRQIATARMQLQALPVLDTLALNETLASVQARIPGLPLKGDLARALPGGERPGSESDTTQASIWQRFKASLAGLVTVQRRSPEQALVSINDQQYLRQGLWLQLESARLALMRRDAEVYDQALNRALAVLEQNFATGAEPVGRVQAELRALLQAPLARELPDISGPWAELQRLNRVRAPQPAAADDGPPQEIALPEPDQDG